MDKEDRRRFPRINAPVIFRYKSPLSGPVVTTNISRAGLRMYCDEPLEIGKEITLDVLLDENRTISFNGRIVWRKKLESGAYANYDIGIEFLNITKRHQELLTDYL
ncbi:MAG: PilZ domain-containing protein [Planctomycetota bacterium]